MLNNAVIATCSLLLLTLSGCDDPQPTLESTPPAEDAVHADNYSLRFHPSTVSEHIGFGDQAVAQVRAHFTGDAPVEAVYMMIKYDQWVSDITYAVQNSFVDLTIYYQPDLPIGEYSGKVLFTMCFDHTCEKPAGQEVSLPYILQVGHDIPTVVNANIGSEDALALIAQW